MNEPDSLVGRPIVAADGADVGTVREIRGGAFAVNAPLHRDYWLSLAHVEGTDEGIVRLKLTRDEIPEHERDEPAAT